MGSLRFAGVLFVAFPNDRPPRHVHGYAGEVEAIVDLMLDGNVDIANRKDAVRPLNAKRSDVKKILKAAANYGELVILWEGHHAKHKIITTDAQIDAAIDRAAVIADEPRVHRVEYRPGKGLDLLILQMSDGHRCVLPREELQGLQCATRDQIANVEILGKGTGLHWPDLDVDLYVPALLQGIYGTRSWMSRIGRSGGLKTSRTKRKSSQANGRLGGRPSKTKLKTAIAA